MHAPPFVRITLVFVSVCPFTRVYQRWRRLAVGLVPPPPTAHVFRGPYCEGGELVCVLMLMSSLLCVVRPSVCPECVTHESFNSGGSALQTLAGHRSAPLILPARSPQPGARGFPLTVSHSVTRQLRGA
jgi:hypothetical protein